MVSVIRAIFKSTDPISVCRKHRTSFCTVIHCQVILMDLLLFLLHFPSYVNNPDNDSRGGEDQDTKQQLFGQCHYQSIYYIYLANRRGFFD